MISTLGVDDGEMSASPDGTLLAVGDKTGTLRIWGLPDRREVTNFVACSGQPLYVKFMPGGTELLMVDALGALRRWRTDSWRETAKWELGQRVNAVCLAPEGRLVACGYRDGTVRTWDVETGRELAAVAGHRRMVTGLAFTPDGRTLATASEDALVRLWDPATLRELATLRGHLLGVHSVQISPDGRRLASGSHAKEAVKLWDLATRQEVASLAGRGSFFYRTTFSPDGNVLAAINLGGELHLWRTPSLAEVEALATADNPSN
jgi:WD40 repeat protein